jgi:hypothetical protein
MTIGKRTIALPVLAASALALLAPGCGSGPEKVSAGELVSRGDQICRDEQQRFFDVQAQPPVGAHEAADQTGQLADAAGKELAALKDMEPPVALQPRYQRYLDSLQAAADLLEKGREAADGQDARRYGELQAELGGQAEKRSQLARQVGFKTCSKLGGLPQKAVAAP